MWRSLVVASLPFAAAAPSTALEPEALHTQVHRTTNPHKESTGNVIIVSSGRSGSTVLCGTVAVLTESDPPLMQRELFGTGPEQIAEVANPTQVMIDYFHNQTLAQPHARYVGFKWKSGVCARPTAAYDDAWRWVGNPAHDVKVLYMTRNYLDTKISMQKHAAREGGADLSSHCHSGDDDCIAHHQDVKVTLDTTTLVSDLDGFAKEEADTLKLMASFGVRSLFLRFEDLFSGQSNSRHFTGRASKAAAFREWNRVLAYLEQPPASGYRKVADAISASDLESTATETQCDTLANAAEVRAALNGTAYADLLEC